jgi:hypothetical protein
VVVAVNFATWFLNGKGLSEPGIRSECTTAREDGVGGCRYLAQEPETRGRMRSAWSASDGDRRVLPGMPRAMATPPCPAVARPAAFEVRSTEEGCARSALKAAAAR